MGAKNTNVITKGCDLVHLQFIWCKTNINLNSNIHNQNKNITTSWIHGGKYPRVNFMTLYLDIWGWRRDVTLFQHVNKLHVASTPK